MSEDKLKETAPKKQTAGQTVKVMYLGPSIISPVPLSHRSVFSGGLPEFLRRLDKKDRELLEACFMPLADAGAALRELEGQNDPGKISAAYKAIQSMARS